MSRSWSTYSCQKTAGSSTLITFLGLIIDTVRMIVKIPEDKFEKLEFGISFLLNSKKLKVKEFESIIGLMAFCARAILSARAFIRRIYELKRKIFILLELIRRLSMLFKFGMIFYAILMESDNPQVSWCSIMMRWSCLQIVPG